MADKMFRAAQRIQRELKEIMKEDFSKSGISVETTEEHVMILKGKILGPSGTPYEGGTYILEIKVPDAYPFKPVHVEFLTEIWHPNIDLSGMFFLRVLKQEWVASMTLRTVLLSIQALLSAPEPDSCRLNPVAAKQFRENHELFERTAKHWSQVYAGAPVSNSEFEETIKRNPVDKGVDEERAPVASTSSFWNVGNAVANFLFRRKS